MPFHKVVSSAHPKLHVIYFHTTGYERAFGAGDRGVLAGDGYTREMFDRHPDLIAPADFILGALWGDEGVRVAELYGFNELAENWSTEPAAWASNPTALRPWVFRDFALPARRGSSRLRRDDDSIWQGRGISKIRM